MKFSMGTWVLRLRNWLTRRRWRKNFRFLSRAAERIFRFRKDQLSAADLAKLNGIRTWLRSPNPSNAPTGCGDGEEISRFLEAIGGNIFPMRILSDNLEAILSAAIVTLAIRTFFLQPFSIPTNSMWPTYRGMVSECPVGADISSWSRLLSGATHYRIQSPTDGEVRIPINGMEMARKQNSFLPYELVRRRRFHLWTVCRRRYELLIGETPVPIELPVDFDLDRLLVRRFFPDSGRSRLWELLPMKKISRGDGLFYLSTGLRTTSEEILLDFYLFHGDVLLVDRLTPHFLPPDRGSAIVFATRFVPALFGDGHYYIKRLAGTEGDTLEIKDGQLLINGSVGNFSPSMAANNRREFPYGGYFPLGKLESAAATVPANHAFVLGDNSANSYDSRFFGPIPRGAIIGRPILRIYPAHAKDGQP
jgi:signal peptidase I